MSQAFRPFIADEQNIPELTVKSVVFGSVFGIIFGAVTVYLALRAGLTVSASIPIAVLAITILKRMDSTILENNIVQTTGSAGESIAAGVVFTLPALIFLGFNLDISRIFLIALAGGILGVLFMIPLRRTLIVKEHANLLYPEGTACADVLIAGEKGGRFAGTVFSGFGLGVVYKILHEGVKFWKGQPLYEPAWYPGARMAGTTTPEYLGVGYIIGPRIAGTIFAGGVLSWLVLIPLIKFFGAQIPGAIFPATAPIAELAPPQIWSAYIRPIGAGAVTTAGLITLLRSLPTILDSLRAGMKDFRAGGGPTAARRPRTEDDLSTAIVVGGSFVLVVALWVLLSVNINPGYWLANLVAAVLIVVFGFLFVTVSSRIVGIIGSSANPISGMTIATLMATCLIFVAIGWKGGAWAAVAMSIGGVVCIAAANAGATSQDLKTGYLVGATPWRQQLSLVIGVVVSTMVIGYTLMYLNKAYTRVDPQPYENVTMTAEMKDVGRVEHEGTSYRLLNVIGSKTIPDGRYYYQSDANRIAFRESPGVGSANFPAPQAVLMSTVVNGILNQNLPWGLVLFGVFIVCVVELLGVRSLSFAVGAYLPLATTAPIFFGGLIRWLVDRRSERAGGEGEVSSGALASSGLIAGGAVAGLLIVTPLDARRATETLAAGAAATGDFGARWWPALAQNDLLSLAMFLLLAAVLYRLAKRKLEAA
ncbi:MAG TPA: oligopeptide transporter, OPT family [Gemmatimonadaceae bacterium]|nr:oligopeptide transporter, OPT family [Gemmatimonadaceae bacterium]